MMSTFNALCDDAAPLLLQSAQSLAPSVAKEDCLLAQLERIDLMLQCYMQRISDPSDNTRTIQGMVLSPDTIDTLIVQPQGKPHWAQQQFVDQPESTSHLHVATQAQNVHIPDDSRLGQLVARFALNTLERDLLLFSILPWFDPRYAMLFAFLQNDTQKKWPTVDLAFQVLCPDDANHPAQRACLLPEAPLLSNGLLSLKTKNTRTSSGWTDTLLQVDSELYHYLIGQDTLPPSLKECSQWLTVSEQMPDAHLTFSQRIAQYCFDNPAAKVPLLVLRGGRGSGRAQTVALAAHQAKRQALCMDLELLPENDEEAYQVLLLALRESRLKAACLTLRSLPALTEKRSTLLTQFSQRLCAHQGAVVCLTEEHTPLIWLGNMPQCMLDMPPRSLAANEALLRSQLHTVPMESDLDLKSLVKRFHISPDTLPNILQEADIYRTQRAPQALLSQQDLYKAFGLRAQQNFGKLAQRITPIRTFEDLVVSDALMVQLQEILAAIRYRDQALESGFARKVAYGLGISALFYGSSGTGKTLVAEVLAGALGVDLIKVDLSTVVNKYIGETEKNLSRIFDLAAADAGVLFFDEADALFGKRSETKDAQDRHANIEVSYLLQRLENYPGLVVLATNNRGHLDNAFTRRLTFITRFPFPDKQLRERMWRTIWPEGLALSADIHFQELADKAEITGANIRNIALLATWLAADEQAPCIGLTHIERALQRELGKVGRIAQ